MKTLQVASVKSYLLQQFETVQRRVIWCTEAWWILHLVRYYSAHSLFWTGWFVWIISALKFFLCHIHLTTCIYPPEFWPASRFTDICHLFYTAIRSPSPVEPLFAFGWSHLCGVCDWRSSDTSRQPVERWNNSSTDFWDSWWNKLFEN